MAEKQGQALLQEIALPSIAGIRIGHAQDEKGASGCTVVICEEGAVAALEVRGGGPASRESELLHSSANTKRIHAVLLSGGSAFGLDAAGGVMRYLAERDIGYSTRITKVPLVCQSSLFDLGVGDLYSRPDADMAYAACVDAEQNNPAVGCVGVGTGSSVGKLCGMARAMKSGVGMYALQLGELQVGALAVVNAVGDVFDPDTHIKLAGMLDENGDGFADSEDELYRSYYAVSNMFLGANSSPEHENTTLVVVVCNAKLDRYELGKVASMAHNGLARCIHPVHTSADGDSIYALSTTKVAAGVDVVGTLAARVTACAVRNAVLSAHSCYGLKAAADMADV